MLYAFSDTSQCSLAKVHSFILITLTCWRVLEAGILGQSTNYCPTSECAVFLLGGVDVVAFDLEALTQ
jgi:hypothetical protein